MNILRKILFPVVPIYYLVTWLRNKLYDIGIKKSISYNFPVIAVGNLSVGGTGKSPMVGYLIDFLKNKVNLATLSRGYGRTLKGFQIVDRMSLAIEVGDEPLQFKKNFEEVTVAVDANRRNGITKLRSLDLVPEVILLDDAYQHRKVKAGFYILLTAYYDLYCNDIVLPTGNLREPRRGADRADVIVVTKCPPAISDEQKQQILERLKVKSGQSVYFSNINYASHIISGKNKEALGFLNKKHFTLVTGIADPKPLVNFYKMKGLKFEHLNFADHHNFTTKEIENLQEKELIITTEKDYMRLSPYLDQLWYQPINMEFINMKEDFEQKILNFIKAG